MLGNTSPGQTEDSKATHRIAGAVSLFLVCSARRELSASAPTVLSAGCLASLHSDSDGLLSFHKPQINPGFCRLPWSEYFIIAIEKPPVHGVT